MVFITEDSDEDSIATDTTADSEHSDDAGFNVEQILAEDTNTQGTKIYLVKWEGYPLYRCTWEDRDQFGSDIPLQRWRKRKQDAARGGRPLFNVEDFNEAFEKAAEEKEERALRRQTKRKKRAGLPSRSQSPMKAVSSAPTPSRKVSAASPIKKKGVAQKVVKTTQPTKAATKPTGLAAVSAPESGVAAAGAPAPTKTAETAPKAPHPAPKSARKTAPSDRLLLGSDIPELKRKPKARVSGETPKDSTAAKFKNLSTQRRYQSYSRNEPAPDPNALVMIDPRTGKPVPKEVASTNELVAERRQSEPQLARPPPEQIIRPANDTASKTLRPSAPEPDPKPDENRARPQPVRTISQPVSKPRATIPPTTAPTIRPPEIQSAYGRRTPPAERRRRSPSPFSPQAPPQNATQTAELPHNHPKRTICKWWQSGSCPWTAETCNFAHSYVNTVSKTKGVTCYYWQHGNSCNKSAEQCDFAHEDTGVYAGRPGTFLKWARPDPTASVMPLATETALNSEPREQSGVTPVLEKGVQLPAAAKDAMTDDSAMIVDPSPLHTEHLPQQLAPRADNESTVLSENVCDDLALAKASILELDPRPFLTKNKTQIENVYILMPPGREGERELLVDYFKSLNCKVLHSGNPHHWTLFRELRVERLLVIHPDETFLGTIPNLGKYLLQGRGWVFSIGVQQHSDEANRAKRAYEARRVFPHGGITFISDDVFAYYPEKATEIIEEFHNKAKIKPPGAELSKIGARPGIRDWLAKLAMTKMEEGGENYTDDRYVKCWDAVCSLCPLEDYDPWEMEMGRMVPKHDALLWSEAAQDLPSLEGLWEKDEAKASDMMADLFAGTAVERMADFSRFWFIYQRPDQTSVNEDVPASQLAPEAVADHVDPRGWMRKYNHIEVMTPDGVLREMRKRDQQATAKK